MGYVVGDLGQRWPTASVPYRIQIKLWFDVSARERLDKTIATWNSQSALKLVLDNHKKAADHIFFKMIDGGGGGYSESVGRKGGRQEVAADFAVGAAELTSLLLHEIGHAVGCIHEHQRPDRDVFIETHPVPAWDHGKKGNVGPAPGGHPVGPYDCVSLMHYLDSDAYVDPKPGGCATLSNTKGLSAGDRASLEFLAGGRYKILRAGKWEPGLTHFAPYQLGESEYLVSYSKKTGRVRFDRVADTGKSLEPRGEGKWATTWSQVRTLELAAGRYVLVYSSATGVVWIDRLSETGSTNVWQGRWSKGWTHLVTLGAAGFQRDHLLVYDSKTGIARLDKVNRAEDPSLLGSGGTTNLWQRKWKTGYTTVEPYRVSDDEWHVLLYNKQSGAGSSVVITPAGATTARKYSWGKGWTHFMTYAQHSEYSYATPPYARLIAYNAATGRAHFDAATAKKWIYGTQDAKWAKWWSALVPCYLGRAGRKSLGSTGVMVYKKSSGEVHYDRLL